MWVRVSDRFGDNGLVGVGIAIQPQDIDSWYIDTFLLSCRIIGRNVEDVFLFELIKKLKEKNKQSKFVIGEFIKGNKNLIVKNFYQEQGFKKENRNWVKRLDSFKDSKHKNFIKIEKKY